MQRQWSKIPKCELSEAMKNIIKRILGLRAKFGTNRRIIIQKMDAKSAFRQIGVDPAGVAAFGYVVTGYVVVDVRRQFRWMGGLGWWKGSGERDAGHAAKTTREIGDFGGRG